LLDCLESIASQSTAAGNWECITVDDGSTDSTGEILKNFSRKDRGRFLYFSQKNSGVGRARNAALEMAKGKYVAFVDADDLLSPHFLRILLPIAENSGAEIVGCAHRNFSGDAFPGASQLGRHPGAKIFTDPLSAVLGPRRHFLGNALRTRFVWGRLYNRKFLERNRLRFSAIPIGEDALLRTQAAALARRLAVTAEPLYFHRKHSASTMSSSGGAIRRESSIACAREAHGWFAERGFLKDARIQKLIHRFCSKTIYDGYVRGKRFRDPSRGREERRGQLRELFLEGIFTPSSLGICHALRSRLFLHFGL
jgi:GT2 family glycosyltransferase